MRFRALLLFVSVILLLSACADAAVSYRLLDDNTINIDYSLTLASSGENDKNYISLIEEYWKDMGFSIANSEDNGTHTLNGSKSLSCESQGFAAAELSSILTDENSLFYDVSFKYIPSYFEDIYDLSASISLKDIIRKNGENNIPYAEIEAFLVSTDNGEYKLSITLPGEVQETNSNVQNGQTCTWMLKYGDTRQLKLITKHVFEENVSHYAILNETRNRDSLLFLIGFVTAGICLISIIFIIAVRRSRRIKTSEINVERF